MTAYRLQSGTPFHIVYTTTYNKYDTIPSIHNAVQLDNIMYIGYRVGLIKRRQTRFFILLKERFRQF